MRVAYLMSGTKGEEAHKAYRKRMESIEGIMNIFLCLCHLDR